MFRCSELTQLQSACCSEEDDNGVENDDDTLRRKPRVRPTGENIIRKRNKKLKKWLRNRIKKSLSKNKKKVLDFKRQEEF